MSIIACSVDECEKPVHVKKSQLCQPHYNRLNYAGTTDTPPRAIKCLHCGELNPPPKAKGPAPTYCSTRCRRDAAWERTLASGKYDEILAKRRLATEARPVVVIACGWCSVEFEKPRAGSVFCSQKCGQKHLDANNPARCSEADCDRGVRAKGLCSMHWRRKARAEGREANPEWNERRKANYQQRRALKLNLPSDNILPVDVYERDEWVCGICSTSVDRNLSWPDPMSPSLDHVLPLSLGGHHTLENVTLAHLECNARKGNRVKAAALSA